MTKKKVWWLKEELGPMLSSCLGGDYIFYDWDFSQGYEILGMLLIFFLCSGIHLSRLLCLFIYSFLLNLNFVVLGEKVCSCQMSLNTRYIFCGTSWTNNLLFFFFCGWWEPISITRLLLSLLIFNYFAFQSYQDYLSLPLLCFQSTQQLVLSFYKP